MPQEEVKAAWKEWEEKDVREAQQRAQPAGHNPHVSSLRVMENGRETLVLSVLHMRSSVHACMPVRVCAPCITRVRAPTTACIFRAQHNSYEFVCGGKF
jgi:hypothetical protein